MFILARCPLQNMSAIGRFHYILYSLFLKPTSDLGWPVLRHFFFIQGVLNYKIVLQKIIVRVERKKRLIKFQQLTYKKVLISLTESYFRKPQSRFAERFHSFHWLFLEISVMKRVSCSCSKKCKLYIYIKKNNHG